MKSLTGWIATGLVLALGAAAQSEPVQQAFHFPWIEGFGGVAKVPHAVEPPRAGTKVVFDITSDTVADKPNKGLESVARYLNLHADAGLAHDQLEAVVVLHGGATKAALKDEAFARHASHPQNPSLPLIRLLKQAGVKVHVCGQSLARNGFPTSDVDGDLSIAVSALTVNINKQRDGFAYVSIH